MSAHFDARVALGPHEVLCEVYHGYYEEDSEIKDDPFITSRIHVLFIVIHLAPSSLVGDPSACRKSPKIILERWDGDERSALAPDWCISLDLDDRFKFVYPRTAAFALLLRAASMRSNILYGYTRPMRRCYCRYKWCDGASVPRGTWRYHAEARPTPPTAKWLAAHPEALEPPVIDTSSAGARAMSRHPSTTDEQVMHAGSLLLGLYILRDISMSRPTTPSNAAAGSTSFPFVPPPIHPRTPDRGKEGPPLEPLTPHQRHLPPLARNAELAARDEAEMRGEDYINTMLAQRMQDPFDDIGTVDDDLDGVEEPAVDDAQEGPAAPEPHQVAAAPTPLPPTPQILHPEGPIGDDFRAVNGEESPHATIAFDECHPALLLLYILVTWLHTQFKLPFRACGAVLSVVYHILLLAGVEPRIPEQGWSTLPTILSHLGIEPNFRIIPLCPTCKTPHPPTHNLNQTCSQCSEPLYAARPRTGFHTAPNSNTTTPSRARLQMPLKSIEAQLRDVLQVPGIEDELEKWRSISRQPGVLQDNFDGAICQSLLGPDDRLFFENPLPPQAEGELRIGLTLGVDWFSYLRSQITASHTSAPLSFNIINLPPHLR
ncbi:hypothetical protein EV121DRAFT_297627 [Schizophyllum commune]